jgi:hypothetical protein
MTPDRERRGLAYLGRSSAAPDTVIERAATAKAGHMNGETSELILPPWLWR